ncbi:MAG: alanine--tRNA ligase [Candidatus Phytoplasma stylosanthis]|uniref:alanine--tRNA ligase n=1 Tax=Candidatus Phytoplasma stylosanthis TaxID=2798314 RepID=UPI00293B4CF5|nr:alanine--tRNA ligase [Candidatus Phytoplasma stylosanthis]MDV3167949.1 alanine--tRNA ligase [Candidatus Phytoplasma stylosanthis]MDV3171042.1 alanine--tRNA ligase [Candidatus Phytoplasma stylosanthis]MDV3173630.1 alanine--tRNA ligase [Candidatus Phytoplasma stylosanthis]MDV3174236.1 alanine--tRNA ligase [Candidatus Phytoplasma stylosanthis]MDV3202707.1 alanine--tRNA ligase [Candidatus Phytoplasma stylosanthis]
MKKMTFNEIKKIWLDFFISKKHHLLDSVSLIPDISDSSLLWVNAGIVPLKKYFDGSEKISFDKIVNIQKCLRTNDIEKVGKSMFHHTFFEMLGNFSIGGYFKKEAIDLAYELLIYDKYFGFPKEKLYITYFDKDTETYQLWLKKGIKSQNLIPLKSNFWEIGEGPCGPCTEIFFDRGPKYNKKDIQLIIEDIPNNRFIEIWNIVFSQYNSEKNKSRENYSELPSKNIDTGAGLERLTCILQDTETTFETDLFSPIIKKISFLSNMEYSKNKEIFRIISDHIKTLVFGIGDDVIFSNIGRGYVLKKILRRALVEGKKINLKKPFLFQLVSVVIDIMEEFYPYLRNKQKIIENTIQKEEEKFLFNLNKSEKIFLKLVSKNFLSGFNFFKLYDTYGLPKDMILGYAKKNNILVYEKEFDFYLKKQKNLSRDRSHIKNNMNKQNDFFLNFKEESEFVGYKYFEIKTQVLKIFPEGIVLKKTPFYPIMGGQNSDVGKINNLKVVKVIKLPFNQHLHQFDESFENVFFEGQEVLASIDINKRKKTSFNHTATHLLYDCFRFFLGDSIRSRGSFLNDNFLRIDIFYSQYLSLEILEKVEFQVNKWILEKHPVLIKKMSFKKALEEKIQILENTNYPEIVRVVQIGDFSIQLCGGTHASNTKDLQKFAILDCKIIGSGVYRIEATSNDNVYPSLKKKIQPFLSEEQQILNKIKEFQKDIDNNDFSLFQETKKISSEINYDSYLDIKKYTNYLQILRKKMVELKKYFIQKKKEKLLREIDTFIPSKIEKHLMIIIENKNDITPEILKVLLNNLFQRLKNDFLCLCYKKKDQFFFLCKSKVINVSTFIKKVNKIIDGKGGGNNEFGQFYSNDIDKFSQFKKDWKNFL